MAADLDLSSFAEGGIDRIIHRRFFARATSGVFVEVGAAGPRYLSNSAFYRSLGWRVIAIEPNPAFADEYRRQGLEVLQYACGERDQDDVSFTLVHSHGIEHAGGGLTFESMSALSVDPRVAKLRDELVTSTIRTDMRRLDTILSRRAAEVTEIDILSIDVEGWELPVVRGLDFGRYRPKVCIVENLFRDEAYPRELCARGYELWSRPYPNEIYVRRDLLSPPERVVRRARRLATSVWRSLRGKAAAPGAPAVPA